MPTLVGGCRGSRVAGALARSFKRHRCFSQLGSTATPNDGCAAYFYGEQWLRAAGVSSLETVPTPIPVPYLSGQRIAGIGSGWGHSAFLTSAGVAVIAGRSHDFKNTLRHINARALVPVIQRLADSLTMRLFPRDATPIEYVAPEGDSYAALRCGPASQTALITASGLLYTVGQNFHGQGGVGSVEPGVLYEPQLVQGFAEGERVIDVALGTEHAVAATSSGALYTWGRGDRGQCGHGDMDSYTRAIRVLGPRESFLEQSVVAVSAGPATSACVTSDGHLWVWGKMSATVPREARGDGWIMADQDIPRLVRWTSGGGPKEAEAAPSLASQPLPSLPVDVPEPGSARHPDLRVVAVTSGQAHVCFLTADGRLWLLGMRGRGVLRDDSDDVRTRLASASPSDPPLTALFPETAWGGVSDGGSGALPTPPAPLDAVPEMFMQVEPYPVAPGLLAGKRIVALRSSVHHSYAVTACGGVYRLGWRGCVLAMPELAGLAVRDVAFGFLHALALVDEGAGSR